MSERITISLPQMDVPNGQDAWAMHVSPFASTAPPTKHPQSLWRKFIYYTLMWLSYRAEDFWHWTYYKARPYAPDYVERKYESYSVTIKHVSNN